MQQIVCQIVRQTMEITKGGPNLECVCKIVMQDGFRTAMCAFQMNLSAVVGHSNGVYNTCRPDGFREIDVHLWCEWKWGLTRRLVGALWAGPRHKGMFAICRNGGGFQACVRLTVGTAIETTLIYTQ